MTTWLVTGGAGYIGAHVVRALRGSGRRVVVLDDFSTGLARRLDDATPVVTARVHDVAAVRAALVDHAVDGVVHLAAKKAAGESVELPEWYYRENVGGMASLLTAMREAGVDRLVYSSSAAVYGTPRSNPVSEDASLLAESPYGRTKVVGEWMAEDAGRAWGLSWAALRYFNVAGAARANLGDSSVNNLIPMVFAALDRGERPRIFGDDYATPDGTCVRDYIHVADLAEAHVAAASFTEAGGAALALNVGTGTGYSVRAVMDRISVAVGRDVDPQVVDRRAGDPPATYAATDRVRATLGWRATHDLDQMVVSAWHAWQAHPPT